MGGWLPIMGITAPLTSVYFRRLPFPNRSREILDVGVVPVAFTGGKPAFKTHVWWNGKTIDEAFREYYLNEWKDSIWRLAAAVCTDNEGFTHTPPDIAARLHLVRQTANKHWLNGALFPLIKYEKTNPNVMSIRNHEVIRLHKSYNAPLHYRYDD